MCTKLCKCLLYSTVICYLTAVNVKFTDSVMSYLKDHSQYMTFLWQFTDILHSLHLCLHYSLKFRLDRFTADVIRRFVIKAVDPSELTKSSSSHARCEHYNTSLLISFRTSPVEEANILRILVDYSINPNLLFSWPMYMVWPQYLVWWELHTILTFLVWCVVKVTKLEFIEILLQRK